MYFERKMLICIIFIYIFFYDFRNLFKIFIFFYYNWTNTCNTEYMA